MKNSIISRLFVMFALLIGLTACGGGGGDTLNARDVTSGTTEEKYALAKSGELGPVDGLILLDGLYYPVSMPGVPQNLRVDFYGDSVMLGYGVQHSPVARIMQLRPGWVVDHHYGGGVSAENVWNGYDYNSYGLNSDYLPFGPQPAFNLIQRTAQVVVIQVGYNDAFRNVDNYEMHLRALVQQTRAEGRIPVLTGVFKSDLPVALQERYNQIAVDLANEAQIEHADWGQITLLNGGDSEDRIHRTQFNSDILANALMMAIERAVSAPSYGNQVHLLP